jgi:hypothetical protein
VTGLLKAEPKETTALRIVLTSLPSHAQWEIGYISLKIKAENDQCNSRDLFGFLKIAKIHNCAV